MVPIKLLYVAQADSKRKFQKMQAYAEELKQYNEHYLKAKPASEQQEAELKSLTEQLERTEQAKLKEEKEM